MKILIPTLGFGRAGGNRVLSEFANRWIQDGHDVAFLVNESSADPYFPTSAHVIWTTNLGRIVSSNERSQRGTKFFNGEVNLVSLFLAISKIGKDYDVILANHSLTAWPIALAPSGKAKKVYYIQAYEPEYYELETSSKSKIMKRISAASYRIDLPQICNSPVYFGYKEIRAKEWVPPGIDFNLFFPHDESKDLSSAEEIVLGCIGRREPAKGIKYVLEAFEALWEQDRRYKLSVAFGNLPEGWEHPGLRVTVPQNDRELGDYYRSLDILVAPGTVQLGAPHYPVMEAMACGVSVVTTGYLPADNSNSWIVPIADSSSIVHAVQDIVNAPISRQTKRTKGILDISSFDWQTTSRKMLRIFSSQQ